MPRIDRRIVIGALAGLLAVTGVAYAVVHDGSKDKDSATVQSGPGEVAASTAAPPREASTSLAPTTVPPTAGPTTGAPAVPPTAGPAATLPVPKPGSAASTTLAKVSGTVTGIVFRPGEPATMYVPTKEGQLFAVRDGAVQGGPVVDVRSDPLGFTKDSERGLLGAAFSADGAHLYTSFTSAGGTIRVMDYPFANGAADAGRRRQLLNIAHDEAGNHDGGSLQLGPDGMLYIAVGDGGSGCNPVGAAQDPRSPRLLGKVLRIDPLHPADGKPYAIPAGNPFGNEVWAFGLRNPWRISFDTATGELWIADVGQGKHEEVNVVPGTRAGVDYGWSRREGFSPSSDSGCPDSTRTKPAGATDPVFAYGHDDGACSVTGGYVYRGKLAPALVGTYLFADYCAGKLLGLARSGGGFAAVELSGPLGNVTTFGQGPDGEVYVGAADGTIGRVGPA